MLAEGNSEVLREAAVGSAQLEAKAATVTVQEHMISHSLNGYRGAEREQVVALFLFFAVFPDDVSVPTELFDRIAKHKPQLFGMTADTRRPHLKACCLTRAHATTTHANASRFVHGYRRWTFPFGPSVLVGSKLCGNRRKRGATPCFCGGQANNHSPMVFLR